ncbi:hypothetical protein AB4308_08455, partial [Vibrio breoganii]
GVIFPSVGVIQVSLNLTGLPASLGKQKIGLNIVETDYEAFRGSFNILKRSALSICSAFLSTGL